MTRTFDAIVVGAGPAGSAAALVMARAGMQVALLERGSFPGEKNMFGGLLHRLPALEAIFPDFAKRAPLERHIVKKHLAFLSGEAATTMTFETGAFDREHNGYTVFRPHWDRWLGEEARAAGATLLTRCLVDDLVWQDGRVVGVRVLREGGELRAPVVVAADGVLSFTALRAGLRRPRFDPEQMALGVKALLGLPKDTIDERFGLVRDQGASMEVLGCTGGIRGGGFLYTNYDSVSVGLVLHLGSLSRSGRTPFDLLNEFLAAPPVERLLGGGRLLEYSAHVIPEGGYAALPQLVGDGILLAGDAAGLCYATGLNLEGLNLAVHSGVLAGQTAAEATGAGNVSATFLERYREKLEGSFVLQDLKRYRRMPAAFHLDRLYEAHPALLADFLEGVYRVDGRPKKGFGRLFLEQARERVGLRHLLSDAYRLWRGL